MPHVDSEFTDEYLDTAVEKLRRCLRDLKKVADRPTALASRERCKNWMNQAVAVFRELRQEYDAVLDDRQRLREELAEVRRMEEWFDYLRARIEDVRREILTVEELAVLAADVNYGETVNAK
jgi:hypothetical protein